MDMSKIEAATFKKRALGLFSSKVGDDKAQEMWDTLMATVAIDGESMANLVFIAMCKDLGYQANEVNNLILGTSDN